MKLELLMNLKLMLKTYTVLHVSLMALMLSPSLWPGCTSKEAAVVLTKEKGCNTSSSTASLGKGVGSSQRSSSQNNGSIALAGAAQLLNACGQSQVPLVLQARHLLSTCQQHDKVDMSFDCMTTRLQQYDLHYSESEHLQIAVHACCC